MELFERAKALADQAAARTKEGVEEGRLKLDLHRAYADLGKLTFDLVEANGLEQAQLEGRVARIRDLETELKNRRASAGPTKTDEAAPVDAASGNDSSR